VNYFFKRKDERRKQAEEGRKKDVHRYLIHELQFKEQKRIDDTLNDNILKRRGTDSEA